MKKCFKKSKIAQKENKKDLQLSNNGRKRDKDRFSYVGRIIKNTRSNSRTLRRTRGRAIHGNEWSTIAT